MMVESRVSVKVAVAVTVGVDAAVLVLVPGTQWYFSPFVGSLELKQAAQAARNSGWPDFDKFHFLRYFWIVCISLIFD